MIDSKEALRIALFAMVLGLVVIVANGVIGKLGKQILR
jgi:hypothetical protein